MSNLFFIFKGRSVDIYINSERIKKINIREKDGPYNVIAIVHIIWFILTKAHGVAKSFPNY